MVRPELHTVRRPFFDCTSVRVRAIPSAIATQDETLHLHAELTRPLPASGIRYNDIKVALRLAA